MPASEREEAAPRRPTRALNALGDAAAMLVHWLSLTRGEKLRYTGMLGVLGAALATLGDFDLLAAASGDASVDLPRAALLGVFAIPLYAFGYWQVWAVLRPSAPRVAFWLLVGGSWASAVGAAIHGMTALAIASGAAGPTSSPYDLGPAAAYLVPAWVAAAAGVTLASACYAYTVAAESTPYPRTTIVLTPVGVVVLLTLASLPSEFGRSRLIPAAPNIAHGIFFAVSTLFVWRARPR